MSISQPIFDGGYETAYRREAALGVLYAAFCDVHRLLVGLPVEGLDFDIPFHPTPATATTSADAPSTSTQPTHQPSRPIDPTADARTAPHRRPTADARTAPSPTSDAPTSPAPTAPAPTDISASASAPAPSHILILPSTCMAPLSRTYTRKKKDKA